MSFNDNKNIFVPQNHPEENPNGIEEIDLMDLKFDEKAAAQAQSQARFNSRTAEEVSDRKIKQSRGQYRDEQSKERNKANMRKTVTEEIIDWVKTICIGIIAGVILVVFVVQRDNVYGDSMNPTLFSGDVIFTQKISSYFGNYDRGDIVILDASEMKGYDRDEYLIKRVIGLPGETVKIEDGLVYIKPVGSEEYFQLEEKYLAEGTITQLMGNGIREGYDEITLGEDEYYCLGDNRAVSNDSRNLGPFSKKRVKAVAVIRVYPFNAIGLL